MKNSSTMFSRRALEVLAVGTPCVSNAALGLRQLVGEGHGLFMVSAKEEAESIVHRLMTNDAFFAEAGTQTPSLYGFRQCHLARSFSNACFFLMNEND